MRRPPAYVDPDGREYDRVEFPTRENTEAVEIATVKRTKPKVQPPPFYPGEDGEVLAAQPRSHRKRWTEAQWAAFEEYRDASAPTSQPAEHTPWPGWSRADGGPAHRGAGPFGPSLAGQNLCRGPCGHKFCPASEGW